MLKSNRMKYTSQIELYKTSNAMQLLQYTKRFAFTPYVVLQCTWSTMFGSKICSYGRAYGRHLYVNYNLDS